MIVGLDGKVFVFNLCFLLFGFSCPAEIENRASETLYRYWDYNKNAITSCWGDGVCYPAKQMLSSLLIQLPHTVPSQWGKRILAKFCSAMIYSHDIFASSLGTLLEVLFSSTACASQRQILFPTFKDLPSTMSFPLLIIDRLFTLTSTEV